MGESRTKELGSSLPKQNENEGGVIDSTFTYEEELTTGHLGRWESFDADTR